VVDELGSLDHRHIRELCGDLLRADDGAREGRVPDHVDRQLGESLAEQACLPSAGLGELPERIGDAVTGEVENAGWS